MKAKLNHYNVIILDINMPVMNGEEFLQHFRAQWWKSSVIALTSNGLLEDKIKVFDLWADDYLVKPFEFEELLIRVKALAKRGEVLSDDVFENKSVKINFSKKKVYIWKDELVLPHKQYLVLEYLAKNAWYPKSKNQIMQSAWWEAEENLELSSTTLESHIYELRKKIWRSTIQTIKWIWYIIEK